MFPKIVNWKGSPCRMKKEIRGKNVYITRMNLNQGVETGTELTYTEFVLILAPENCQFPTDITMLASSVHEYTDIF